jgi:hypothetical protein
MNSSQVSRTKKTVIVDVVYVNSVLGLRGREGLKG